MTENVKQNEEVKDISIREEELNEVNEMLYVRNMRMKVNNHLLKDGKMPDDPETLDLLMRNLKDMDSSAISRSRIKSDEKTGSQQAVMHGLINATLLALRGGKALPPSDISNIEKPEEKAPELPESLDEYNFVPGEQQIGTINEDIDSFRKRMDKEEPNY